MANEKINMEKLITSSNEGLEMRFVADGIMHGSIKASNRWAEVLLIFFMGQLTIH